MRLDSVPGTNIVTCGNAAGCVYVHIDINEFVFLGTSEMD